MATAAIEIRVRGDQPPAEQISSLVGPAIRTVPFIQLDSIQAELEPRPTQILLGTLSSLGCRLIKAIPVSLETAGDEVIASWQDADEFGTGASMSLACEDLGRTVADLYKSLKAESGALGPDLIRIWRLLEEHIVESK